MHGNAEKTRPILGALNLHQQFKLQVVNAVIRSKLIYGLESIQLNETALKHMNVFQLKGLRKIMGMKTTFVNRANSNEEVFRRAEIKLNRGNADRARGKGP